MASPSETSAPAPPQRYRALAHLGEVAGRHRLLILGCWALLLGLRNVGHGHGDWDFFADAGRALFGDYGHQFPAGGALGLFAHHPEIVTGPLTLVGVRMLAWFGPSNGYAAGVIASSLLGVVAIAGIDAAARAMGHVRDLAVLLGGIVLLPAWSELAGYGHLDDALAFALLAWALWAVAARHPIGLGLLLGLAIATKQWGVTFLPLVFALEPRDRWRSGAIAVGVGAAAWLPFVIADSRTISQAGNLQIVANDSTLALFNYPDLQSPTWIRPAQLLAALAVVTIAVLLKRWPAVLLVGTAARIALDPATWTYYTPGLVLGALAYDIIATKRTIPVWTVVTFLALAEATVVFDDPNQRAAARLIACVATLLVLLPHRKRELAA